MPIRTWFCLLALLFVVNRNQRCRLFINSPPFQPPPPNALTSFVCLSSFPEQKCCIFVHYPHKPFPLSTKTFGLDPCTAFELVPKLASELQPRTRTTRSFVLHETNSNERECKRRERSQKETRLRGSKGKGKKAQGSVLTWDLTPDLDSLSALCEQPKSL